MLNNRIDKMSLMKNWYTEDIDQENLTFSVFSTGVRSKRSIIHNHYKFLIGSYKKCGAFMQNRKTVRLLI